MSLLKGMNATESDRMKIICYLEHIFEFHDMRKKTILNEQY